jgi:hypothetical protein
MNLSKRMDKLETVLIAHLTESGEIRADIKWLKRAVYWMVGGGVFMNLMMRLWR